MEAASSNEVEDYMPHPLENELVVENIFDYFEPTATAMDWKNIRAVCKTWHFEALSQWRDMATLNLNFQPPEVNQDGKEKAVSASEFLALLENDDTLGFTQLSEKPFQKYKLKDQEIDLTNLDNKFWTTVGPLIKHLTLEEVNFKTETETVEEVMQFLVSKTPNLECLNLNAVLIDGKKVEKPPATMDVMHQNVKSIGLSNFYAFSFLNFPNCQEATLEYCWCTDWVNLVDPTANLVVDPPPGRLVTNTNIKRLYIQNCQMNTLEGMPRLFRNLMFASLEHLYVNRGSVSFEDEDMAFLSLVITNHNQTLKSMEYFSSLTKLPIIHNFIHMKMHQLTELRACGNVFGDFEFLGWTRNLQLLHFDVDGNEQKEKMKAEIDAAGPEGYRFFCDWDLLGRGYMMKISDIRPLQHLRYLQINFELSKDSLKYLAKWMPNLKVFKMILKKDTIPFVCRKWPELEHLECMFGSNIGNENVTGIGLSNRRRKKALVDMKHLTTFKFCSNCNGSTLSDDVVSNGFLLMPELIDLTICVSSEFSEEAEMLLTRGIQKVQVNRNYESNPLHSDWQCCRDTEYRDFILSVREFPRAHPRPS